MSKTYADIQAQIAATEHDYDAGTPWVRLWDKEHKFLCDVPELNSLTFDHLVNAAGGLDLAIPYDSPSAEMLRTQRDDQVNMITVDLPDGYRWHGTVTEVESILEHGKAEVTVKALHSWQHLESILFWANPLFPAQLQPLAADYRIGPARTVLASLLAVNLARLQLPLWQIPTYIDVWDPQTYNLFARAQWPIAVKPVNPITDTSRWVASTPCFQSASEIINEVAAGTDSGLVVEMNLWLPGDKQPWFLANFTRPTLWIDIKDYGIERNFTGTMIDGLIKVGIDAIDDAAGFVLYPILGEAVLGEDGEGLLRGALKIEDRESIPVYRGVDNPDSGVIKHTIVESKPLASQVVVGGKSPDFVNKAIDIGAESLASGLMAAISAGAGGVAGAAALGPAAAAIGPIMGTVGGLDLGPASSLLATMAHDKLFAYFAWEHLPAAVKAGPYRYREVAKLGGTGLGIMLYQDIVNATYSQRAYTSHTVEVENARPYRIHIDFKPGQLVGIDKPGEFDRNGRPTIHVARCTQASYTYDRTHGNAWQLSLGDKAASQDPGQRSLERLRKVMQTLNTAATNSSTI